MTAVEVLGGVTGMQWSIAFKCVPWKDELVNSDRVMDAQALKMHVGSKG